MIDPEAYDQPRDLGLWIAALVAFIWAAFVFVIGALFELSFGSGMAFLLLVPACGYLAARFIVSR